MKPHEELLRELEKIEVQHFRLLLLGRRLGGVPGGAVAQAAELLDAADRLLADAYASIAPDPSRRKGFRDYPRKLRLPKPAKPRPDFPLWWRTEPRLSAGGFWSRKVYGSHRNFGTDPVEAERRYYELLRRWGLTHRTKEEHPWRRSFATGHVTATSAPAA